MRNRILVILLCFFSVYAIKAQVGYITTVAGNGTPSGGGYNGDNIPAVSASLNYPTAVLVDDTGNIYFSDTYNYRIRKIDTNGIIHTIAGCGSCSTFSNNGALATSVGIVPRMMAFDKQQNIYFVDDGSTEQAIYKIDNQGKIYIVAPQIICNHYCN
jgi:hypothetical protein